MRRARRLRYIGRQSQGYLDKYLVERPAPRLPRIDRCACLYPGGGPLACHRDWCERRDLQHRRRPLLRSLPYADAERLVILWNSSPGLNITEDWFSTAQYFDIRNGHHGFEQVAIAIGDNYNDREMLEWAGLPIVMGNSIPELKSLGWSMTGSNDDCGLAEAIHKYVLRDIAAKSEGGMG